MLNVNHSQRTIVILNPTFGGMNTQPHIENNIKLYLSDVRYQIYQNVLDTCKPRLFCKDDSFMKH